MRLLIRQQPTGTIDGFSLDGFRPGREYEVGTQLAGVLVAVIYLVFIVLLGSLASSN